VLVWVGPCRRARFSSVFHIQHAIMSILSAELHPKRGFHTTYTTQISISPILSNCTIHLLYVLPPNIFVDPYELTHRNAIYTFQYSTKPDLELPVTALHMNGSALLLNVSLPEDMPLNITVEVPMHARYGQLATRREPEFFTAVIPWPSGFWLCDFERESFLGAILGNSTQLWSKPKTLARDKNCPQRCLRSSISHPSLSFQSPLPHISIRRRFEYP
jgi:hypothetical protein